MIIDKPSDADFEERIRVNLDKGLSLEQIRVDTEILLSDFEWTVVRCQMQAQIYRDLIRVIDKRIGERDASIVS